MVLSLKFIQLIWTIIDLYLQLRNCNFQSKTQQIRNWCVINRQYIVSYSIRSSRWLYMSSSSTLSSVGNGLQEKGTISQLKIQFNFFLAALVFFSSFISAYLTPVCCAIAVCESLDNVSITCNRNSFLLIWLKTKKRKLEQKEIENTEGIFAAFPKTNTTGQHFPRFVERVLLLIHNTN